MASLISLDDDDGEVEERDQDCEPVPQGIGERDHNPCSKLPTYGDESESDLESYRKIGESAEKEQREFQESIPESSGMKAPGPPDR